MLLRHLDYAEDFDIAELEIELEAEGKLDEFIKTCKKLHNQDWKMVRKGAQRISRASAVLHEIEPKTYPTADSWTQSQRNRDTAITLTKVVERCFELVGRRRPGKALVWVIDEVGQHVARSDDKIEDLRAVVQEFGLVGRNLVKAKKLIAPAWMIVTSQEKLEEVVSALDSKRVQLAKLQDRFRHRVDLAPSDIREVATKRVLAKKDKAEPSPEKAILGKPRATERRSPPGANDPQDRDAPRPISSSSIRIHRITSTSASASSLVCGSSLGHRSSTAAATARSSSKPTRCSCPNART